MTHKSPYNAIVVNGYSKKKTKKKTPTLTQVTDLAVKRKPRAQYVTLLIYMKAERL